MEVGDVVRFVGCELSIKRGRNIMDGYFPPQTNCEDSMGIVESIKEAEDFEISNIPVKRIYVRRSDIHNYPVVVHSFDMFYDFELEEVA